MAKIPDLTDQGRNRAQGKPQPAGGLGANLPPKRHGLKDVGSFSGSGRQPSDVGNSRMQKAVKDVEAGNKTLTSLKESD